MERTRRQIENFRAFAESEPSGEFANMGRAPHEVLGTLREKWLC